MALQPFFDATGVIQMHILAGMAGLTIGPFVLFRHRRDGWHRKLGYVWLTAMVVLAVSGLFIPSHSPWVGPFGPIHLLSVIALWGVAEGLWHVRHRNIAKHRASMQSLWFGTMGIAGLLTLLPGRRINLMVLGGI